MSRSGSDFDTVYRPAGRSPITGWWHADRFGSGTVTSAAIQAAIDAASQAAAQTGQGGTVYIPDPPAGQSWTLTATVNLKSRITIRGNNRIKTVVKAGASIDQANSYPTLVGPVGLPLFQIGLGYPTGMDSLAATDTVLEGISANSKNAPVVRNWSGLNWRIHGCDFRSFFDTYDPNNRTIELRYAYRGLLEACAVSAQNGWAVDGRDNINGVAIRDNILTGGSGGGAIQLGLATSVTIENNTIESSKWGLLIGAAGNAPAPTEPNPAGVCHNIIITGNYVEDSQQFVNVGAGVEVRGAKITANYFGGGATRTFPTPDYCISLGRAVACTIESNSFFSINAEPFIKVAYVAGGSIYGPAQCRIGTNYLSQVPGTSAGLTMYDTSALPNTGQFYGQNEVTVSPSTESVVRKSCEHEWTSPVITASAGLAQASIAFPEHGALMLSAEILGANGTIASTIRVGSAVTNSGEILVQDPSLVALTNGYALIDLSTHTIRSTEPLAFRVVAGTGTGTYQVRLRWYGA